MDKLVNYSEDLVTIVGVFQLPEDAKGEPDDTNLTHIGTGIKRVV